MIDMKSVWAALEWLVGLSWSQRGWVFAIWTSIGLLGIFVVPYVAGIVAPDLVEKKKENEKATPPAPIVINQPIITRDIKVEKAQAQEAEQASIPAKVDKPPEQAPDQAPEETVQNVKIEAPKVEESIVEVPKVEARNVIAPRNIAGLTLNITGGTNIIQVAGDLSVTEKDYKLTNPATGDEIKLKIYLLFNSAAWSTRSSSKLITYKNREITLDEFLGGEKFASDLNTFQAIVCLGLASSQGSPQDNVRLSDQRANHLCGEVSRRVEALKRNVAVYGLPLGYNKNASVKDTAKERAQRSVVILGVQSATGQFKSEEEQRRVISCAIKEDLVDDFKLSDYSEVAPGKVLKYIKLQRGEYYTQGCD
jgi:hypothetical protein